jgi:hypothetical protein
MRRIRALLALAAAASIFAAAPALADMECGARDVGNRHYAVCWLADGGQRCYLCPGHYRSGGSVADCRDVSCDDLPPE